MNNIRFISSYTKGTIYKQIFEEYLLEGLQAWGLPYHVFETEDLKSWYDNIQLRPYLIRQALLEYPNENIVWIDADARILKYPEVLFKIPSSCHIGINYLNLNEHYQKNTTKVECLDNTSYFKNCAETLKFCDEWIDRSLKSGQNYKSVLNEMINEKIYEDLNLFIIPRDYCYVVTTQDGMPPRVTVNNPVIAHYKASREARYGLYGD